MKHTNCDLSQLRDVAGGWGERGRGRGGQGAGQRGAGGGAEGVNLFPVLCTQLIQLEGALKHEIHPYCSPQLLCFAPIFLKVILSYTVKKVSGFPVPSRDVTYQTLPGREII
jgi:hypothetical protein